VQVMFNRGHPQSPIRARVRPTPRSWARSGPSTPCPNGVTACSCGQAATPAAAVPLHRISLPAAGRRRSVRARWEEGVDRFVRPANGRLPDELHIEVTGRRPVSKRTETAAPTLYGQSVPRLGW